MSESTPEIWLPIVGHEGRYSVSDLGKVWSHPKNGRTYGIYLSLKSQGPYGHIGALLWRNGRQQRCGVHRLVMEAFVGPCPIDKVVCHNDGDATNNQLVNLRYDTPKNNSLDVVRHGRNENAAKTHCKRAHLLSGVNLKIGKSGRACLACEKAHGIRHKTAQRGFEIPPMQELADSLYVEITTGVRSPYRRPGRWVRPTTLSA